MNQKVMGLLCFSGQEFSVFSCTSLFAVVCVRIGAEWKPLKISLLLMQLQRKCR